ncbi:MAG: diguanylate cyclase [Planctomycetota bacterium]|jgi:diguanylate cyclase (GGDEF)-like protein
MKILLIDDDPAAVALAKARLADEGHEVFLAAGGVPGLTLARREHPDLILLDIDMPDMSGYDVCRALKNEGELCMIPVIFLSGSSDAKTKVRGLDLGAVDFVTKPFDAFELRARVRAALRTKRLQDMLIQYAHVDPLTGLPNRRALMERLEKEWARIQRYGGVLSVVMADIDNFKRINDTYGHSVGDKILQAVSSALASQCREADTPARYGGEELTVLLPECDVAGATILAERCRQAVQNSVVEVNRKGVSVTASFGVADSIGIPTAEALIVAADTCLYAAKAAGRNTVRAPSHASAH